MANQETESAGDGSNQTTKKQEEPTGCESTQKNHKVNENESQNEKNCANGSNCNQPKTNAEKLAIQLQTSKEITEKSKKYDVNVKSLKQIFSKEHGSSNTATNASQNEDEELDDATHRQNPGKSTIPPPDTMQEANLNASVSTFATTPPKSASGSIPDEPEVTISSNPTNTDMANTTNAAIEFDQMHTNNLTPSPQPTSEDENELNPRDHTTRLPSPTPEKSQNEVTSTEPCLNSLDNKEPRREQQLPRDLVKSGKTSTAPNEPPVHLTVSYEPEYSKVESALWSKINDRDSTILFHAFEKESGSPRQLLSQTSSSGNESWGWSDLDFVRLPFSSHNRHITRKGENVSKWEVIQHTLVMLKSFCIDKDKTIVEKEVGPRLAKAISSYCTHEIQRECNFQNLNNCSEGVARKLAITLPFIIEEAFNLRRRLRVSIPILKCGMNHTIYLNRKLACSLLANGFLCTFPAQTNRDLPAFNFHPLYNLGQNSAKNPRKMQKLKSILEYFSIMMENSRENSSSEKVNLDNIISFQKRYVQKWASPVNWPGSDVKLCEMWVEQGKKIEDAKGTLQVDFANRSIGGGVLHEGAVQEEIRFIICPELICSRLFTQRMNEDEVVVITGAKQYSSYDGYSSTFKFRRLEQEKLTKDSEESDNFGREHVQVVAMDAYHFQQHDTDKQYEQRLIDRELHKSYVAFIQGRYKTPVATGNWGCGAFNGDPELKFLMQWMAASINKREKVLYHASDQVQAQNFIDMCKFLTGSRHGVATVGKLYVAIINYAGKSSKWFKRRPTVFEFVKKYLSPKQKQNR